MRILGEFDKKGIKVTVFKMNDKISLKFEYNLIEIIHKFRDGASINSLDAATLYCDEEMMDMIQETFSSLNNQRYKTLLKLQQLDESSFDEII